MVMLDLAIACVVVLHTKSANPESVTTDHLKKRM